MSGQGEAPQQVLLLEKPNGLHSFTVNNLSLSASHITAKEFCHAALQCCFS